MSKTTDNGLKRAEKTRSNRLNLSDFLCLTPFSAIFQLNHGIWCKLSISKGYSKAFLLSDSCRSTVIQASPA
jgi:hypothetical protein